MKNKMMALNVKLGQAMVNKELKKKDGAHEILIALAIGVVGVALVMVYKDATSKLVTELTTAVGNAIKKVFTGL